MFCMVNSMVSVADPVFFFTPRSGSGLSSSRILDPTNIFRELSNITLNFYQYRRIFCSRKQRYGFSSILCILCTLPESLFSSVRFWIICYVQWSAAGQTAGSVQCTLSSGRSSPSGTVNYKLLRLHWPLSIFSKYLTITKDLAFSVLRPALREIVCRVQSPICLKHYQ